MTGNNHLGLFLALVLAGHFTLGVLMLLRNRPICTVAVWISIGFFVAAGIVACMAAKV